MKAEGEKQKAENWNAGHVWQSRGVVFQAEDGAGGGAGGVATGGDNGGKQTPGGASDVSDVDNGGGGQQGGGAAQGWDSQALPEGHWGIEKGFKTWGDVDKGYRSSSEEARRWQEAAQQQAAQAAELQSAVVQMVTQGWQQGGQQPQQTKPAANPDAYFGFPNKAAYAAAWQADPQGTMDKVLLNRMQTNPGFSQAILKMLEPQLGQVLQPVLQDQEQQRQTAYVQQIQSTWDAFAKANPTYAEGTPGFKALDAVLNGDPVLKSAMKSDYGAALELAVAKLERARLNQVNTANQAKLDETRQRAGTARVGGASGAPAGGGLEAQIRANAEEARRNGAQISEQQIQEAVQRAARLTGGGKKNQAAA